MKQIYDCYIPHKKNSVLKIKEFKKEDSKFTIKGYASTFDSLDLYGDIVKSGAFKNSIKKTKGKWPIMLNHKDQVGMNTKGLEDSTGLYVESDLFNNSDIPKSKEAIALIKENAGYGVNIGLSIGGVLKKIRFIHEKEPKDGFPIKMEILEFDLIEHSVTPIPANRDARVTSSKMAIYNQLANKSALSTASKVFFDFIKKLNYELKHK